MSAIEPGLTPISPVPALGRQPEGKGGEMRQFRSMLRDIADDNNTPALPAKTMASREENNKKAELGFDDLVDALNPLQHIPVVGQIYRAVSDKAVSAPARMIGGMLFGGPIGFMAALVDSIVTDSTGKDLAHHALALLDGKEETVQVAESAPKEISITANEEAKIQAWQVAASQAKELNTISVAEGAKEITPEADAAVEKAPATAAPVNFFIESDAGKPLLPPLDYSQQMQWNLEKYQKLHRP
ncbi:MAG: hypothetical protein AB7G80_07285 [Dongiaceae bacterium]